MDELLEGLENPSKSYRPLVRWWWPGMDVQIEVIHKELELLDACGFGGAEIQSFLIGTPTQDPSKTHRFAPNPFYFEILKGLLNEAKKRDLTIDLTISSSWPPGGTHISKEDNLKTILSGSFIIKGPLTLNSKIPEIQLNAYYKYRKIMNGLMGGIQDDFSKYITEFKPIAVIAVKRMDHRNGKFNFISPKQWPLDVDSAIDITNLVDSAQILHWDVPEGKWQIFSFYSGPTGMTPMSDARSDPKKGSLVVDIFDASAVHRFLDGVLGNFGGSSDNIQLNSIVPFIGKTLRALFTDSQEIADEWYWASDFFTEFEKRRGYDIRKFLPACYIPNHDNQFLFVFFQNENPCFEFKKDDIGKRVRYDWALTLSELFIERYIRSASVWSIKNFGEQRKLLHRIQVYGIHVDVLDTFAAADIPETETLFSGSLDFFKLASSAAILYDKKIVTSETFSWTGRDLMTSPLKWKAACDRLFVSGINQVIYHGWTYPRNEEDYPRFYPWSGHGFSENLNPTSPYFDFYPELNMYVTRLQYLLSHGKTKCNIGLFYPLYNYNYKHFTQNEDLVEGYLPGYDAPRNKGPIAWFSRTVKSPYDKKTWYHQRIAEDLMKYGYSYVHLNETAILKLKILNGKACLGSAELEVIILPNIESISLEVAQKIEKLTQDGIKIVFIDQIPSRQSGYLDYHENDMKIRQIVTNTSNSSLKFIEINHNIGEYLYNSLHITPYIEFNAPNPNVRYIHRQADDYDLYFIRTGNQSPHNEKFNLFTRFKTVFLVNPWTGEIAKLPNEASKNDTSEKPKSSNPDVKTIQWSGQGQLQLEWNANPYESAVILASNKEITIKGFGNKDRGEKSEVKSPKLISYMPDIKEISKCLLSASNAPQDVRTIPQEIKKPFLYIDKWDLQVQRRNSDGSTDIISNQLITNTRNHVLKGWHSICFLKYSSGPGIYSTTVSLNSGWFKGGERRIMLDLGKIHDIVHIKINNIDIGSLIVPPYVLDVTKSLKVGENHIELTISGSILNSLIGYGRSIGEQWKKYRKRPLMPIGLVGPITLYQSM